MILIDSSIQNYYGKQFNTNLDYDEIPPKRSDTVFILGSGASISQIKKKQWQHIQQHETIAFNWFVHQSFIPIDFYIVKGVADNDLRKNTYMPQLLEFGNLISSNSKFYQNTLFLLQKGSMATNTNRLLFHRILPKFCKFRRYFSDIQSIFNPSKTCHLASKGSVLISAINFAYNRGYENIVFVGIDLYDRNYFWLNIEETRSVDLERSKSASDVHHTTTSVLHIISELKNSESFNDVKFYTFNEKSLLSQVMPVYDPE